MKDYKKVQKILRRFINIKNNYVKSSEIFPENQVRLFLKIDENTSSCDGLLEIISNFLTYDNKNKEGANIYDLAEIKGKSFDRKYKDIGQTQMLNTIKHFKKGMKPNKGISFIIGGTWLIKRGYYIKKNKLYRSKSRTYENLENRYPLEVYIYHEQSPYKLKNIN